MPSAHMMTAQANAVTTLCIKHDGAHMHQHSSSMLGNSVQCSCLFQSTAVECNLDVMLVQSHAVHTACHQAIIDACMSHKNAVLLLHICLHRLTLALPGKGMGVPGGSDTTPNSDAKICLS